MKQKGIWNKVLWIGVAVIAVLSVIYFFISKPQLEQKYYTENYSDAENADTLGEFVGESVVTQTITTNADYIKGISVKFANFMTVPEGTVEIAVTDEDNRVLKEQTVEAALLPDSEYFYIQFDEVVPLERGAKLNITVRAHGGRSGAAVTLWSSAAFDGCELYVNGEKVDKTIIIMPDEYRDTNFVLYYWIWTACILAGFSVLCVFQMKKEKDGVLNPMNEIVQIFGKYRFLLTQLVGKEFKNKYRRSYLGILWSLLNPLLMMVIVSSVFSFIFRFNIENFPVYLILGQITFNFFSEATQVSVSTITGSGQLIKKVYLPKYIFPISKVFFSFVNFLISFIAVIVVMLYYRISPNINMLFLPVWMVYYFMFTLGISLLLAALMVFLRDTQHLYSLVMVALGYLTPIFYPVDSLAPWMQQIMNLNPLYHYVKYLRNIFFYAQCPSLLDNVVCLVLGILSLTIGMRYFFKKQKTFILYI